MLGELIYEEKGTTTGVRVLESENGSAKVEVSIQTDALRRLTFPPPKDSALVVVVHEGALKAPSSPHTQLIGLRYGDVIWAGALGEHSLTVESEGGGDPRQLLGDAMGAPAPAYGTWCGPWSW